MTPEEQKKKKRKKVLKTVGILVGVVLLFSCGVIAGAVFVVPALTAPPAVDAPTEIYIPKMVTAEASATSTPQPTKTPIPTIPPPVVINSEPVVLAEVSGIGDTVTNNFTWPQCQKAVFYWSTEPNSYGSAYLIVHLWNTAKGSSVTLVNAGESDMSEALKGETLQPLAGGEYYFVTKNTTGDWTITVQCED